MSHSCDRSGGMHRADLMRELTRSNGFLENGLLIRELCHRINNEFASAISQISLAAARSRSCEVKAALDDVSNRLHHYADVHRTLQMPDHRTFVDASLYFEQLCRSISQSKLESSNIKLVLIARPVSLPSDQCWRLGMIVYELVTNAARHAFHGAEGYIKVDLRSAGNLIECRVSDNGASSRPVKPGRGLSIIQGLVRLLDGRLEQSFGSRGSKSLVIFPI
jgi:two-component sensor histidine kinase